MTNPIHNTNNTMTTNSSTSSTTSITTDHHHHDNNYYNNNNYNNGAGRALLPADLEQIRDSYVDNIGPLTGAVASLIEDAFYKGMLELEEILMAIEETGLAPHPSPYYLRAILKNWAENGVTVSRLHHEIKKNNGMKWWK